MNSFQSSPQAAKSVAGSDEKRKQKTMQNFKRMLQDLITLFREAAQVETVYLYWVNRSRGQFVLEAKATILQSVVFQDRISFDKHFLNDFKSLSKPVALTLGEDINPDAIDHYHGSSPVDHLTILPFVKNEETIAITVVESKDSPDETKHEKAYQSFIRTLGNTVDTFLEMSDLYEDQKKWSSYEKELQFLQNNGHYATLINTMLNTMQLWLDNGSISFICKGMGSWANVFNSVNSNQPLAIGLQADDHSLARDVIGGDEPEFSVHFNQNPKRLSRRESRTEGATLAIPMRFQSKTMGVVLVYDENPLLFKESVKHKFNNTVRLTALNLPSRLQDNPPTLFNHSSDALIPDVWKRTIDNEIKRLKSGTATYHTWVSMIRLTDISQIRTQLRIQDLSLMQKDLVHAFNPGGFDVPGFIGFHSDYTYVSIIQSENAEAQKFWARKVNENFAGRFELTNGKYINTDVQINSLKLSNQYSDSYEVITQLK